MTAPRRHLVVMVKEPAAGRVKTRLARQVGVVTATSFYRASVAAVVGRLARDPRWRTVLAVAPDTAMASRAWDARVPRMKQGGGDLGARMQRVMDRLPPGPALIVGSDIPAIRPHHVAAGFAALGGADAVLGRAADGGYWLTGLKRFPTVPRAYGRVRWSSVHALADTVANLAGHRVVYLDPLSDVDDAAALAECRAYAGRRII